MTVATTTTIDIDGARLPGVGSEGDTWSFAFFCDAKTIAVRRDAFAA